MALSQQAFTMRQQKPFNPNHRHTFQDTLLNFTYTRDVKTLLRCTFTTGLGIIFNYIRGTLKAKYAPHLALYAKRLKEFLGLALPACVRAMDHLDGDDEKQRYIDQAEDTIVTKVIHTLQDHPPLPLDQDQIDGPSPPPPEGFFNGMLLLHHHFPQEPPSDTSQWRDVHFEAQLNDGVIVNFSSL